MFQGWVVEWSNTSDCKSDASGFDGSNPSPTTICWCGSMAEQLICNQQVVGSTPITSSKSCMLQLFFVKKLLFNFKSVKILLEEAMERKDMLTIREQFLKINSYDMIKNKNLENEKDFIFAVTHALLNVAKLNLSKKARLELSLILRIKGIIPINSYYKVKKLRPSKMLVDSLNDKTTEFPMFLCSQIAYGTEKESEEVLNFFKGEANLVNKWLRINKKFEQTLIN